MKNIKKILKKIISIICIICVLTPNIAFAATETEFQNAIASYCYNFYKNSGAYTRYDYGTSGLGVNAGHSENYAREQAYLGNMLSGEGHNSSDSSTGVVTAPDKAYFFDCVGWVSFAIHNSVGLGNETFTYFAVPTGCSTATGNGYANLSTTTDLKPGDILRSSGHVMIYVGDIDNSGKGSIIHCTGYGKDGGPANGSNYPNYNWGLICEYYDSSSWKSEVESVARVTDSTLAGLDASTFNTNGTTISVGSASDSAAATGTGKGGLSTANMSDFYYNGIPDGKYSVTKGFWERLIDALAAIFNFLVGLIPNVIKMVVVGWTAIFENLITATVKTASGGDNIESVSVTSTDIESGDNITIEKIVFNQISIFDVNFFNFNDVDDDTDSTGEAGATQ